MEEYNKEIEQQIYLGNQIGVHNKSQRESKWRTVTASNLLEIRKKKDWNVEVNQWSLRFSIRTRIEEENLVTVSVYNNIGVSKVKSSLEKIVEEVEKRGERIMIASD